MTNGAWRERRVPMRMRRTAAATTRVAQPVVDGVGDEGGWGEAEQQAGAEEDPARLVVPGNDSGGKQDQGWRDRVPLEGVGVGAEHEGGVGDDEKKRGLQERGAAARVHAVGNQWGGDDGEDDAGRGVRGGCHGSYLGQYGGAGGRAEQGGLQRLTDVPAGDGDADRGDDGECDGGRPRVDVPVEGEQDDCELCAQAGDGGCGDRVGELADGGEDGQYGEDRGEVAELADVFCCEAVGEVDGGDGDGRGVQDDGESAGTATRGELGDGQGCDECCGEPAAWSGELGERGRDRECGGRGAHAFAQSGRDRGGEWALVEDGDAGCRGEAGDCCGGDRGGQVAGRQ